jgi:hypothetical protein
MIRTSTFIILFVLLISTSFSAKAQQKDSLHKTRLALVVGGEATAYTGALLVLNGFWYKYNNHSAFHFYNDNKGWMQVDKMGHAFSAYTESYWGLKAMQWVGVERKKAIIFGGGLGIIMQTPIEILDGFSEAWGASWGDLIANTTGSAIVISQQLAWNEQRIRMKFSYSPSPYTQYRPKYFGTTPSENFIRDYNGHTYWLSGNIKAFFPKLRYVPNWLNIDIGTGADGMLAEYENPRYYAGQPLPEFKRQRQYYLSLDVDFEKIKTKSKVLKTIFPVINIIKLPFPALEYNQVEGFKFHPLLF